MVKCSIDQIRSIMDKQKNIRNISVIAHVDHGKSTMTDSLVQKAGIISEQKAGEARFTDTRADEQERCITIKSTAVAMYYKVDKDCLSLMNTERDGDEFLVNLIDSPGHVDFSSEVSAALRVTDGAIVVVACKSGICVQTKTVLMQALAEKIVPVLFCNKLDMLLQDLRKGEEDEFFNMLDCILAEFNTIIADNVGNGEWLEHKEMDPLVGNVGFGSALFGWGFTLWDVAFKYHTCLKFNFPKLMSRLWGHWYYNPKTGSWSQEPKENHVKACYFFILKVIKKIKSWCEKGKKDKMTAFCNKMQVKLPKNIEDEINTREKFNNIMHQLWPLGDSLIRLVLRHLPSPVKSQIYRAEVLYNGPAGDECYNSIKNCTKDGELMVYISKMIPAADKGRFYALGRVFGGTVETGQKVKILSANYELGRKEECSEKAIPRVVIMIGSQPISIENVPCGNICAFVGIDQHLLKTGTLTTSNNCHGMKTMKFSVSPVVRVAVEPMNPSELPKLIEGLRRLSKSDPMVQCSTDETGQHIIAGAGELHLEICLKDLEEEFACIPIKKSSPVVSYRETVTEESSILCLSKSPNNHNRFYVKAYPMSTELCEAIEKNQFANLTDVKERARYMADNFNADPDECRKLWGFEPNITGANLFVDITKGTQYLSEIRDNVIAGFQAVCKSGPLCEEPMRGVSFKLHEVTLHADAIHRGAGQIIPVTRRVLYASALSAKPRLMEPMYVTEIQGPVSVIGGIYSILNMKRGTVLEDNRDSSGYRCTIKAYLPVAESFGYTEQLREATGGQAFPQCVFDHWSTVVHDPLAKDSKACQIILDARKRKGLKCEVPLLDNYLDKL